MNGLSAGWFTVAEAHAVLARPCGLNSFTRRSAALAKAVKNFSSDWFAVANAQAVLASSHALNLLTCRAAAFAKAQIADLAAHP